MTTEQKMRVQAAATDAISQVLEEFEPQNLASHETNAAYMIANVVVEWNRGRASKDQVKLVSQAAHDILEAVRRRRKELEDGTTSID